MKSLWLLLTGLTAVKSFTQVGQISGTVRATLYEHEDVRCFTDLPFGIVNLPSSYERRNLQKYRLRACDWYLVQRARDGRAHEQLLEWLPVGLLELGVKRVLERAQGIIPPNISDPLSLPEATKTREQITTEIRHLSEDQLQALKDEMQGIVLFWRRGNPSELALYFSTYLLMYKLMRISEVVDLQHAPCIITLEDDAVNALTFLHPQRLRDLCLRSFSIDAWQLMWYVGPHDYRDAAAKGPRSYEEDGVGDYDKQYYATHGVMWRTLGLPKQLEVIAFDDEENEQGPWLNCTHHECVTDAFMKSVTNVKIPVTPWIGNPIMDHTTGLHADQFLNHQFSVRAMSASFFTYEWASIGASSAAIKKWNNPIEELKSNQVTRAECIKMFHEDPDSILDQDVHPQLGRWVYDLDSSEEKITQ